MDTHVSDQLLKYVEGRLSSEARGRLETHLAACATCRAELEMTRQTLAALSDARRVLSRFPARLRWETVQRQVRSPLPALRWRLRLGWQVAASMAVVITALASNLALSGARAETPSVPAIQTPAAHILTVDTATALATQSPLHQASTFTPTFTPGPN